MPIYPFILLGAVFLAVLLLPPLVAAYIDYHRELRLADAARDKASRALRARDRKED